MPPGQLLEEKRIRIDDVIFCEHFRQGYVSDQLDVDVGMESVTASRDRLIHEQMPSDIGSPGSRHQQPTTPGSIATGPVAFTKLVDPIVVGDQRGPQTLLSFGFCSRVTVGVKKQVQGCR